MKFFLLKLLQEIMMVSFSIYAADRVCYMQNEDRLYFPNKYNLEKQLIYSFPII